MHSKHATNENQHVRRWNIKQATVVINYCIHTLNTSKLLFDETGHLSEYSKCKQRFSLFTRYLISNQLQYTIYTRHHCGLLLCDKHTHWKIQSVPHRRLKTKQTTEICYYCNLYSLMNCLLPRKKTFLPWISAYCLQVMLRICQQQNRGIYTLSI